MKKLLIITFLFISIAINATKIYVKAVGSDANTGLSDAQALLTIAHANIHAVAGDSILFNRGDTWREQIVPKAGTAGAYTYYGSYGTGVKPLFLGSVTANSGWSEVSANIWQNSNAAFTVDVGNLIFNNGASFGIKQMVANPTLDHQGDFWYDFTNDRIRMYSVSDPAVFYTNIECALKKDAITAAGNGTSTYQTFQNLDFMYWGSCVRSDGGSFVNFYDIDMSFIGGSDQFSDYTTRFGNGLQIWAATHDITIKRCRIDNIYDAGISPQNYDAGKETYNLYIRNNVVSNCEHSFEFFSRGAGSSAHDIYFENNTCVNAGGGWGHNQRPDGPVATQVRMQIFTATKSNIYIRNNVFYNSTEVLFKIGYLSDLINIVIDYNLYYQSSGNVAKKAEDDVDYVTLAYWKTATSQEAHSVGTDPLFISVSDFHLQVGSPAKDTGLNVGLIFDFDIHRIPYNLLPDIGAYEYGVSFLFSGGKILTSGGKVLH